MNRHITIDWPYDQITLEFKPSVIRKPEPPLRSDYWRALNKAERAIYAPGGGSYGCHAWTDVMENDGDAMLNAIWSQAWIGVEAAEPQVSEERQIAQTAHRVAQALAVISFGAEILLR